MTGLTAGNIRAWLGDPEQWPNDSYDVDTLVPSATQARRDTALKPLLPAWFWHGEEGASILSIGSGKGYFERRYWSSFRRIYVVDPSDYTRGSLEHFPIPNAELLSRSIFDVSPHQVSGVKYGWLGACIHYLFGEFHGWNFLQKLAMMIEDTLVVDAGIFDADTRHGSVLQESWQGQELFETFRLSQFSYDAFLGSLGQLWTIDGEWPTPWIDGRRTLVLKRVLPPIVQRRELGPLELVKDGPYAAVHKTAEGYFKETKYPSHLLVYDVVSKTMGWDGFVRWRVYDGEQFVGFVTRDCGDQSPAEAVVSERLYLGLMSWLLPLGLLPADVARQNIRLLDSEPIWIDIDLRALNELDARIALWLSTNVYKQYERIPPYVRNLARDVRFAYRPDGRLPDASAQGAPDASGAVNGSPAWEAPLRDLAASVARVDGSIDALRDHLEHVALVQQLRYVAQAVLPKGAIVGVISKGDESLLQLPDIEAWHFPRTEDGVYAGHHPADDSEVLAHLDLLRGRGMGFLIVPCTAAWWLEFYPGLRSHLDERGQRIWQDESCAVYRVAKSPDGTVPHGEQQP